VVKAIELGGLVKGGIAPIIRREDSMVIKPNLALRFPKAASDRPYRDKKGTRFPPSSRVPRYRPRDEFAATLFDCGQQAVELEVLEFGADIELTAAARSPRSSREARGPAARH